MIIEAIVEVFFIVINFLAGLLPSWSPVELTDPVAAVLDSAYRVFPLLAWSDHYVPTTDAVTIITLGATIYGVLLIYNAIVWTLSKLHIGGGGSD